MTEFSMIPEIETERLLLRPFTQDDLDPFAAILADPEVIRGSSYSGKPMTRSQAWNWLCMMLGHWYLRGFGIWAVEEKRSGKFIGRIGLQLLEWLDDVELVWMLARSTWGNGYATEGVNAVVRFAFESLDLPEVSAVIKLDNLPSLKLAERVGMTRVRELDREGTAFYEYKLSNPALES